MRPRDSCHSKNFATSFALVEIGKRESSTWWGWNYQRGMNIHLHMMLNCLLIVFFAFISQVLNSAIAQFCLEVIAKHGEPAKRLCNKDPLTLKMGSYVIELFPNVIYKMRASRLSSQFSWVHLCLFFRPNFYLWFAMDVRPYTQS